MGIHRSSADIFIPFKTPVMVAPLSSAPCGCFPVTGRTLLHETAFPYSAAPVVNQVFIMRLTDLQVGTVYRGLWNAVFHMIVLDDSCISQNSGQEIGG